MSLPEGIDREELRRAIDARRRLRVHLEDQEERERLGLEQRDLRDPDHPDFAYHGTGYGYRRGCRCERCGEARREERIRLADPNTPRKRRWRGRKQQHEANFPHGTRTGYQYGCKCEPCMAANRLYRRDYERQRRAEAA